MMNKKSGLLAVTGGKTNDCRNVEELAAAGDPEAQLAFDMFVYKIAAKAAEMATSMCGMDTLVFTAGIGEHAPGRSRWRGRSSGLYGRQDGSRP